MSDATAEPVRRPRRWVMPLTWIVITSVVAVLPLLGLPNSLTRQLLLVGISALLVSAMNLSYGWAGELNFGLPAMYAVGAYLTAYIATRVVNELLVCLLLAAIAAVLTGLLAGAPGLRAGGWMLAVATFMLVTLIPVTLQIIPYDILGGQSGFTGIPRPEILGLRLDRTSFFIVSVILVSLWFAVYRNAVRSPFGHSLLVLQHGRYLAPSLGLSRYRLKLATYALSSVPVGVAGGLFAFNDRFISPESMGLHLIIMTIVAVTVAGRRSIYAVFVGAVFVQIINDQSTRFGQWGDVAFGVFLVIGGLAFGGGVSGASHAVWRRLRPRRAVPEAGEVSGPMEIPPLHGADLVLESVSKVFGGVHALKDISLFVRSGRITALIGPNGSGKTTTLNVISGFERPTAGRVLLGDTDITGLSAVGAGRSGIARTFQTPAIPIELSVLDVVASSRAQRHRASLLSTVLRLPGYRRALRENREIAAHWLGVLGLEGIAGEPATAMPLGTRRLIELARALASDPAVVLLDEVASGLDRDEVQELADVLRRVRDAGATIILVEHNFSLVRSLADHIVVLANGSVLTEGDPREIAEHPQVLERFLGSGAGVSGTTIAEQRTEGMTKTSEPAQEGGG